MGWLFLQLLPLVSNKHMISLSSMARAGTAATGSGGVTGAAGTAAACGALFTARARCSRRREAWSIFFVSNFLKNSLGSL
jgi:hypothetical protein